MANHVYGPPPRRPSKISRGDADTREQRDAPITDLTKYREDRESRMRCSACRRYVATQADLADWRKLGERNGDICFDTTIFGDNHLLPEEEAADADTLRAVIVELRKVLWSVDCQNSRLIEEAYHL